MMQLLCHLWGDFILQSNWMAQNKTKSFWPAWCHATIYSLIFFVAFRPSRGAWLVIYFTHFFIDRYRLARYVVWAKNWIGPHGANLNWRNCKATGYLDVDRLGPPAWMAVWLLIIADNTLHLTINYFALRYL